MDMATKSKAPMNRQLAFVALGISLIGHTAISPCFAVSLSKKPTALQYEVYSKLSTGAGPQTNDLQKQEPQLDTEAPQAAAKTVDLSPVTMDEGNKDKDLGPAEEGVLKATVKREQAMSASGPIEQTEQFMKPKSIKAEKALNKDANDRKAVVNQIGPIALHQSEEQEANEKDAKFTAEKIELADLWDSTLARSQDIQFVMQKLMPSNGPSKTNTIMMKMLSATIFGGMSAMTMMAPNMGGQLATNAGASLMLQALGGVESANQKKAKISQEQAVILYKIVRDTAEKLVLNFRDYKRELQHLERANENLSQLQGMVKDFGNQSPSEQIKMQSTLMDKQSNIEHQTALVTSYRQALVDLAGSDAVAKLDKQLEIDKQKAEDAAVATPQAIAGSSEEQPAGTTAAGSGTVPN